MRKYNAQKIEKKWQKKWAENNYGNWKAEDFSPSTKLGTSPSTKLGVSRRKKLYLLVEFPYTSGEGMHVGHCRSYAALDVLARKKRMEGYNVLYPMGWDAFGLPTENYAIKTGIHPAAITKKNIIRFRKQLQSMGLSFDWSREINTTDPKYYKWTQWIFIQFFKHGLAYQAEMPINWCPSCKIGLANEEVINNKCERCGAETEKRNIKQWLLKITSYAKRLLDDLEKVDYLDKIKTQQINWLGKSEGTLIKFRIVGDVGIVGNVRNGRNEQFKQAKRSNKRSDQTIQTFLDVFTTRVDTIFGCTYCVAAPEHSLIKNLEFRILNLGEVKKYIEEAKKKSDLQRQMEWEKVPPQSGEDARNSNFAEGEKNFGKKTGVELKGIKAVNPFTNEEVPIFVTDYVLGHYGTGAVMAVPAHDNRDWQFAKKYNLPIKEVIIPADQNQKSKIKNQNENLKLKNDLYLECFEKDGVLINSNQYTGMTSAEVREKMAEWLEKNNLGGKKITYKLRDWIFSRQHYWGEPIPLVFCPACKKQAENLKFKIKNLKLQFTAGELLNPGWMAVSEKDLPVILPNVKNYQPTDTGKSPLAKITKWVNVKCPQCGGQAKRETDTMPTWAGSSWYYLAYLMRENPKPKTQNPKKILNSKFQIPKYNWNKRKINYWMPVDLYNGGMEHTTLHLLYSRFWHKFLYDLKLVKCPEPYQKRISHGMVLGEGGIKMSKSKGNVVNPDEQIQKYGADSLRLYEMFMGPFDEAIPWDPQGIVGMKRWIERIYSLKFKIQNSNLKIQIKNSKLEKLLHKTIKKVGEDIENFRFNTAISAMMIFTNELEKEKEIPADIYSKFLILLSIFAPHLSEELWQILANRKSPACANASADRQSARLRRCFGEQAKRKSIFQEEWPKYNPRLIKEETFELVVQINGKVRDKFQVSTGISEGEAKRLTIERKNVKMWLVGKSVKKVVFVKNKLINIVC